MIAELALGTSALVSGDGGVELRPHVAAKYTKGAHFSEYVSANARRCETKSSNGTLM